MHAGSFEMSSIIFSELLGPLVYSGAKTKTRRIAADQPPEKFLSGDVAPITNGERWALRKMPGHHAWPPGRKPGLLPPYKVGQLIWVREPHYRYGHWEQVPGTLTPTGKQKWQFVGDSQEVLFLPPKEFRLGRHQQDPATPAWHKRIARFMPRWASRTIVEVADISLEFLQDISESDAIAEGVTKDTDGWVDYCMPQTQCCQSAVASFATLWESIYGAGSWAKRTLVWNIQFEQ